MTMATCYDGKCSTQFRQISSEKRSKINEKFPILVRFFDPSRSSNFRFLPVDFVRSGIRLVGQFECSLFGRVKLEFFSIIFLMNPCKKTNLQPYQRSLRWLNDLSTFREMMYLVTSFSYTKILVLSVWQNYVPTTCNQSDTVYDTVYEFHPSRFDVSWHIVVHDSSFLRFHWSENFAAGYSRKSI